LRISTDWPVIFLVTDTASVIAVQQEKQQ
jgi:hypothetical protein